LVLWVLILAVASPARSADPQCDAADGYAASVAFVTLKNEGLLDNYHTDFSKTKVVRLASQRVGKDLYRQVHRIVFTKTSGETLEVIAVNDASHEECSMSGVDLYVVGKRFHTGGP
jgi:hypothetical protein